MGVAELNGNSKGDNKPGLYEHKESGARVFLEATPELGTPMIDAFVQAGYVRIADTEVEVKPEVVSEKKITK